MAGKAEGGAPSHRAKRIFTIPPAAPFLDTLARAILSGALTGGSPPGPLALADTLVYLPNHTACRELKAAFLRAAPSGATLLPRIRPIGGAEEDALLILHAAELDEPAPSAPVTPSIGALERRMVLTHLILSWAKQVGDGEGSALRLSIADTPAAASELAIGLMRLMDEADTEHVDLAQLPELMPERFAAHEKLSLDFLDIVLTAWPGYLDASDQLNPMARRNQVMGLEADALRELRADRPVIIAGSLGTIPATAALIEAAHSHPRGAVVLPGADLWLDDASWERLADHPEHPQAAVRRLLERLGASRADIATLPAEAASDRAADARARFISEAMRPSSTVAAWPAFVENTPPEAVRAGLADVSLIAAPTVEEEAAAIALILREAAETPGRTASLVTPNRTLARRVCAQLGRWGLHLPDGAGARLATTPPGIFHQLIAEAAATGSQMALLALLKHPLTRLGLPHGAVEAAVPVIEMAAIRQPWSGDGTDQLARSLALTREQQRKHPALDRLADADWDMADAVIAGFAEALKPLLDLGAGAAAMPLRDLAAAHRASARLLTADENAETPLLDAAGEAMARFMEALESEIPGPLLELSDYPALFGSLLRLEVCPDSEAVHPRIRILGPREARLMSADTVIVAGLNEGTWPQVPDTGPWLNRAMREALGLPPAERQTALAAHDFTQLMGASEVILTRALKEDGTPTVASRWLARMEALLGGFGLKDALAPKRPWLHWATAAQTPQEKRGAPPSPCPPVSVRPRRLTVSEIATLMANPYAIFARHILKLDPLEPLESEPGGSERGRIIHETLHRFARQFPDRLPEDIAGEVIRIFDGYTAHFGDNARIAAFWRPRMERFARWFAETEPARRQGAAQVFAQVSGELAIDMPAGPFTLRGSADRIDLHADGSLAIYDYKAGGLPKEAEILAFKAPLLPLQALIAQDGHLRNIKSRKVTKLAYLSAKGGDPAGEELVVTNESAATLAKAARDGLEALIARFDDEATPYRAMRRGGFSGARSSDAYAHLARVEEWSGAGISEEG